MEKSNDNIDCNLSKMQALLPSSSTLLGSAPGLKHKQPLTQKENVYLAAFR